MSGLISRRCPCGFIASRKRGNLTKLESIYSWIEGRLAAHQRTCAAPDLLKALKNLVNAQRAGLLVLSDHARETGLDYVSQAEAAIAKTEVSP
jgi:hypothetical protein